MHAPSGTVTFLFTDIEGSTRLWERYPSQMKGAVSRHDEILRSTLEASGGSVFKTVGDGFCVVFPSVSDALGAALSAQAALKSELWPEGVEFQVRIALHTGGAELRDGDYFGLALSQTARILAAAHGGQVLISQAALELLADSVRMDVAFKDLGEHRLKDLTRPQRIFQLLHPTLPSDFPPLRTLERNAENVPAAPDSLIGRGKELLAIRELLRQSHTRVLTLVGPGGAGKTRLAMQTAAEVAPEFADGAFWVSLDPLGDASLVLPSIGQVLGVNEAAGQTLFSLLSSRQLLVVLDNFEHVMDAAPGIAEAVAKAPQLKVLVTSREPLRIKSEQLFQVFPLPVPSASEIADPTTLQECPAVRLFVDRAKRVAPGFSMTAQNAGDIADLCRRLDGLPLAIELAAARCVILSPKAILERLAKSFDLLSASVIDGPNRHRTLRKTLEWSYDLLSTAEQVLFARLGVFAGGFTLEAAESVCEADIDALMSLVQKSLVVRAGERSTCYAPSASWRSSSSGHPEKGSKLKGRTLGTLRSWQRPRSSIGSCARRRAWTI